MAQERRVKLFRNGRNQAVQIPSDFELAGEYAIMRKEGERLIIEASPPRSLLDLLSLMTPIDEDFPEYTDEPAEPVEVLE